MPNNNPHGHNQYTKPELRSQRNKKPSASPARAPHTDAPQGTDTSHEHESHDSQESSHDSNGRDDAQDAGGQPAAQTASVARESSSLVRASGTSRRGFASMDAALQREIASKGGHSQGRENNPGNFANNRERAREAGRKGGEAHGHR